MRFMDLENESVYRIRFTTTTIRDNTKEVELWGPYDNLSTAKAIVTREKNLDRGYDNPSPWKYEWVIEQAQDWKEIDA